MRKLSSEREGEREGEEEKVIKYFQRYKIPEGVNK